MEWHDEGIVLGSRKHGETSAILEIMTPDHGRHLGLVRGGRSRRLQPVLQPGNRVAVTWRARLDEHLGSFQVEPVKLNAARLMESALAIHGIQLLAAHLRLLPERDPHPGLFTTLEVVTEHLGDPDLVAPLMARFELAILEELGFGLDLSRCALTGATEGLGFVSPKTGRAVTREAGSPWADKLLPLPALISRSTDRINDMEGQLRDAFALTGYFLHRDVYEPRGIEEPTSRTGFIQALMRSVGRQG